MYNSSNLSKFKSQRNVCKIDLNDGSERQRQSNTPTVSKRISNFSPTNHGSVKNSSSFHTLLSQLQPSTTKNPKNYSQQKQMLLTKKNEIIKNAIKQSLSINKKPGTPKLDTQENWEYTIAKSSDKYGKENELPTDSGVRSREKMDQFYYNMGRARPVSVSKQHNVNRASDIASFISPKNRSFVQKAVIPNSTVNLSGISNANEPKTANTTIIKYNQDYKDGNSYVKGRSFDLRPDASPSSKHPVQNRILLDLDESLNLAPLDQVKTSNTTAHARYSKSREDIQNILASNIHYQPLNISDYLTRQPPANLPCKIIKESETIERPRQKENIPDKDLFDLNMSPIKSNNRNLNNISDPYIKESDSRNAKNLANQPYPTIIKQINLNSNTPTSVGKPPLHSYAQQAQDYYFVQDAQQKAGQEALKHKTLNIQTVKENKRIEFPSYLQNLTCDRQKPMVDPDLSSNKEAQQRAIFQPAMLNYIERLSRNRNSNENSREYIQDRSAIPDSHFRFPSHGGDPSSRRSASGHMHRMSYGDAPKRLDLSSQTLKVVRHDSMVENTAKHLLNTSDQLPNGRHLLDVGRRPNEEPENVAPQSVKANTFNPERYLKELNENVPIKENRASQDQNQNQIPPIPPSKNDEKEHARRQSALNEVNIMDLDPEEKEMRIKKFREEYVVGKQIGQGAYATVRIGLHKPTNTKVAIKIYEKVKIMDPMRRRSVRREIKLMQRMDHPSIIKILDVVETNNHMNIVMEYIGGTSLHSFLKAQPHRRLKEEHAFNIFKQIVSGLYYCHARCIAHRDIKLENMLLDNHGNLKIIDFGFSTCIPNDKKVRMFCGTPSYMAPEIVTKVEYCGPPADIWALGVLLFALLSGTFPFRGENDKELYRKIANGEFTLPEYISEKAASLISKMITVDPDRRATAKEIMNDPWYLMHIFTEKKPERRTARSSSAAPAEEVYHEKAENRLPLPMNINTGLPITEQQFMPIANYLKSPPYNPYMHTFERPSMTNVNPRDDDLSKEFMKHLSPNNFKSLSKQTPTAGYNPANTFYLDNKNMTYNTINIKDNPNGSYVGKDMTEAEMGTPDDNFDENRLKCKKTLSEIEIWNVPANISEKSYKRDSGKSSFIQNRSFNRRGDENANVYDHEIFTNMMKMGYKEEEINQGLRERNGSAYAIFNRMQNEKKALNYSNYADSINSDQNNNSFNLSSGTGLKRKSLNLFVQKNPSQGTQGKENAYGHIMRTGSTKDFAANDEDVLRPLGSNTNTNRKNIPW